MRDHRFMANPSLVGTQPSDHDHFDCTIDFAEAFGLTVNEDDRDVTSVAAVTTPNEIRGSL